MLFRSVRHGVNGMLFDPVDMQALAGHMAQLGDGIVDSDAMGMASETIIGDWSPARFGEAVCSALSTGS